MDDKKFFNAFNLIENIGCAVIQRLFNHFSDLKTAWEAPENELREAGLKETALNALLKERNKISPEKELEKLEKENINIVAIKDTDYPELLKQIYNPPFALYVKGHIKPVAPHIAIVGSRKTSSYGKQAAQILSKGLASKSLTIVSGLATGIDTIAHTEALQAGQETIAVLGSGIDTNSIYPASNKKLAEAIINQGALISEFPVGTAPLRYHFPMRNRIISGLSLATLIIEAGETSGALITAKYALEQNREVFAIPGSIFSENSIGTNNLIKSGAKLTTNAQEIIEELNLTLATKKIVKKDPTPDNEEEKIILEKLSHEPIHVDKISETTKLNIANLNAILTMMEMKGKVKNLGGMMYVISS